jgi:pimeloyl-ACP methyl ester carboxylesterase
MEISRAYDASAGLSQIKAPTPILQGKRDRSALFFLAQDMHPGITDSKMVIFKGGHIFFIFTERQTFLEAIEEFIELDQ